MERKFAQPSKVSKYYIYDCKIKAKFLKPDFLCKVIENIISNFTNVEEKLMISKWFFNERKTVLISLPLSNNNVNFSENNIYKKYS